MEAAGGGSAEISARLRDWCAVRAPDDLKRAADTAHRARKKYDKVITHTFPYVLILLRMQSAYLAAVTKIKLFK